MDLIEKIRFLGILILCAGLICIPVGMAISSEGTLIQNITNVSSLAGMGAYCMLLGFVLAFISFILPKSS